MSTRKLERLPQREGETEPVDEAECKRDQPPLLQPNAQDVLERHVDDRHRDERFHERLKPQRVWREVEGRGDERHRVRKRERGHDCHEWTDAAKRNHDTGEKQ